MRKIHEVLAALRGLDARLQRLEQDSEVMKTVLIVKEPASPLAATAFDGLRKQILAAAGERRSHLTQLAQLHAALRRSVSVDDALLVVEDWMQQAGVIQVWEKPQGMPVRDLFDVLEGDAFDARSDVDVVDPAYVDASGSLLRSGRARMVRFVSAPGPVDPAVRAVNGLAEDSLADGSSTPVHPSPRKHPDTTDTQDKD